MRASISTSKYWRFVHFVGTNAPDICGGPYGSAVQARRGGGGAAVLDAAQREPVTIRRQNREVAVVISTFDYRRLTSANLTEFQHFCDRVSAAAQARGLTEDALDELLRIIMDGVRLVPEAQ